MKHQKLFKTYMRKNGYEDCYSEKMKNIIIKLGFENLQDLIKNLQRKREDFYGVMFYFFDIIEYIY